MLLGTQYNFDALNSCGHVSIPREDSCFWEPTIPISQAQQARFNPQRGFMLLGTQQAAAAGQSREAVSIPREDSCFWEQENKVILRY